MKVEKRTVAGLPAVYSTAELRLGGRRYLAAVSENRGEHAYIIDPGTLEYADLWIGDTGVMNVVQIPGREQLLAIVRFYPVFQSREAAICLLEPTEKGYMSPWHIREVMQLPFCHRIGIVENENGLFVIGCQLCRDKDFQEDWTKPGSIWMAPVPEDGGDWALTEVFPGFTKNHGLYIDSGNQVYICSENGVTHFDMAHYRAGDALCPRLVSTTPTSDIWIAREGGRRIAATIEPFHGDSLGVYELTQTRIAEKARFEIDFGHVVWAGTIFGRSAVIAGSRGGERKLEVIFWRDGERIELDRDVGPTQITLYEEDGCVKVLSANHGAGEVAVYTLRA